MEYQPTFSLKMDADVKVEDTIEVPLSTTSDPTCSVSDSTQVKEELFCANLNTQVKHEDSSIERSNKQIKFEAPDIKFAIKSGGHDINIKLEPLESEELLIKDENDQNLADGTTENSPQPEYFCGLYNSKFTYKSNLQQRMKIHLKKKLFKCSICEYKCTKKSNLLKHMKTHTGDKPFKCGICDYKCIEKSHMSRHIKTHTGDKPHKCGICGYRCIQKGDLSRHIKTHARNQPFKCSLCDYKCRTTRSLSKHIKTHTGEKPFKCESCDYRTIKKWDLKGHIKIHV